MTTGLLQQFQDALQQSQQSAQSGGKKRRPVRKPVRAAAKPKAKPKRLVNKRALHNKLMRQLGGFFEAISQGEGFADPMVKKEKYATTPANIPMGSPKTEKLTLNDVVNSVPLSLVPKSGGGHRRYKKKVVPKKRPAALKKYRFSGGYEGEEMDEEFQDMAEESFTAADSSTPLTTGGRRRTPVRRAPVRRARSPSSSTRRAPVRRVHRA